MKLKGRVALVTGAAGGIGTAIVKRFREEGASVAAVDKTPCVYGDDADGEQVEPIRYYQTDLTQLAAGRVIVDTVVNDFGRLDILVNCAGVFRGKSIADTTIEDWRIHIDVIATAPFFLIQAAVPYLKQSGRGRIINITSISGLFGTPGTAAYSAAKGALSGLTRALMSDLAPEGINVNAIAPGNVATQINAHLRELHGYVEKWESLTPSGIAFLRPEDIANTAAFLASDDAANIHGQEISVDGGVSTGLSAVAISLEG